MATAPEHARALIRFSDNAIGGYACVFDRLNPHMNGGPERVRPGAFRLALQAHGWFLLENHEHSHEVVLDEKAVSLASMRDHTFHVEEDDYGLWFEAALSNDRYSDVLMRRIEHRVVFASVGAIRDRSAEQMIGGVRVVSNYLAWEISLVCPPHRPARSGTWVRTHIEARRLRPAHSRLAS